MGLIHKHTYTEVKRRFTPPPKRAFSFKEIYDDAFLKMVTFGVTTIELRCDCGNVKIVEGIGDLESETNNHLRV